MGDIINIKELKKGAKAGMTLVQSGNFDMSVFEKNCEKLVDWADSINLEPTAGNVLVLSTIASLRTMLGDELFDRSVIDENGEISDELMNEAKDKALEVLGFRMNGDEVEEIHDEPTAE